jgi:hypothetical protein
MLRIVLMHWPCRLSVCLIFEVPVRFDEEGRYKLVEYRLQLSGTTWRVDDLHYPDGATFRGLLKPAERR